MSKKVTVVNCEGKVLAVAGGRKKAAKFGGKVLAVLRRGQLQTAWYRPAGGLRLPVWMTFARNEEGAVTARRVNILDTLGPQV